MGLKGGAFDGFNRGRSVTCRLDGHDSRNGRVCNADVIPSMERTSENVGGLGGPAPELAPEHSAVQPVVKAAEAAAPSSSDAPAPNRSASQKDASRNETAEAPQADDLVEDDMPQLRRRDDTSARRQVS